MALTRGKTHLGAAKLTNPSAFDPRRALTLRDVSEASGVSEMTVSRVLRRFQTEGLINVDRREMEILDMVRLATLAAPVLRS